MRFGLSLPHYGFSLPSGRIAPADAIGWATRAEELGFDSVWISDHFFYSYSRYGVTDRAYLGSLEPLTTLAAAAAATERVRLGSLVLCTSFRHPALLGKAAATLDLLSGGRFDLGLGAGWLEEEYDAFGYRFGSVGERFDELEGVAADLARRFDDPSAPAPAPLQRPFPIWLGGKGGPRLLRLAARHGAGWNVVWRTSPQAHEAAVADVALACEREGRDPATFRRSVGLYGIVGETVEEARARFERARASFPADAMRDETWASWRADTLSGSPEQVIERVGAFAELGVEELILSPWTLPFAVIEPEIVEVFAERVIPRCR